MMAEKARLFGDERTRERIFRSKQPEEMKILGREVRGFDSALWNKAKYSIVLNGNYYKFAQDKEMRDYLLSTTGRILVEASPFDKIWGIGYSSDNPDAKDPTRWRGRNLLGFALMEVRDDLAKTYKNYSLIDWKKYQNEYCCS
jgi:ribA/ribD-fused uncharacterized protein